jgi:hypothetical protein
LTLLFFGPAKAGPESSKNGHRRDILACIPWDIATPENSAGAAGVWDNRDGLPYGGYKLGWCGTRNLPKCQAHAEVAGER